jgi:hypothetical protein
MCSVLCPGVCTVIVLSLAVVSVSWSSLVTSLYGPVCEHQCCEHGAGGCVSLLSEEYLQVMNLRKRCMYDKRLETRLAICGLETRYLKN